MPIVKRYLVNAVIETGVTRCRSEAKRLITQGCFAVNGAVSTDCRSEIAPADVVSLVKHTDWKIGKKTHANPDG